MADSDEALQLKRRARRRLVGAIALVTFVVIILPLILDKEPGPAGPPLKVEIPGQDSGSFNPRVVPSVPPPTEKAIGDATAKAAVPGAKAQALPAKVEAPQAKGETTTTNSEGSKAESKTATASTEPANQPVNSKAEEVRALAALSDKAWSMSLEAFSNEKNVKQLRSKLSAAGIKSYTEPVKTSKGELTRVRAGPFASKEAAEKARAKLAAMGLKPGAVASR